MSFIEEMNSAIDTAIPQVLSHNQQVYQRLKLALNLNLHRQIFVAVCDDFSLRDRLVGQLNRDLKEDPTTESPEANYPRLVSLNFDVNNPNLLAQIAQWVRQNPAPTPINSLPSFQIVGIERLTRQSTTVQRSFLRHLQSLEPYLPRLKSNLLLWLPQPWLNVVQQSAPEFWRWCTGVFLFQGEPTPIPQEDSLFLWADSNPNGQGDFSLDEALDSSEELLNGEVKEQKKDESIIIFDDNIPEKEEEEEEKSSTQELQLYSWQDIEKLNRNADSPELAAQIYLRIGHRYRDRIANGDASKENLTIAIQAYYKWYQSSDSSDPNAPEVLNDLGNFYWLLSGQAASTEQLLAYLLEAIKSYHLASNKVEIAPTQTQVYSMIQNNLGTAYNHLARYVDTAENLINAIAAYEAALKYRTPELDGEQYASSQNNLGTAYWHLAQHQEPQDNLKLAIAAYEEALAQYNPETAPLHWAMMQNNLGTAYWNLSQHQEDGNWLHLAIEAYEYALQYRTSEVHPVACAATQNNLGTAYWHLSLKFPQNLRQKQAYLQKAIVAFTHAIKISEQLSKSNNPAPISFDLLSTYNNLGLLNYQLATEQQFDLESGVKSNYLKASLEAHLQVLAQVHPEEEVVYKNTFNYIINTIRACYRECGISGQNMALGLLPGYLLPEVLPKL
ncbi:MAG: tetratricopeptide repeat protein [Spirulinaceae cyanobacterium]